MKIFGRTEPGVHHGPPPEGWKNQYKKKKKELVWIFGKVTGGAPSIIGKEMGFLCEVKFVFASTVIISPVSVDYADENDKVSLFVK